MEPRAPLVNRPARPAVPAATAPVKAELPPGRGPVMPGSSPARAASVAPTARAAAPLANALAAAARAPVLPPLRSATPAMAGGALGPSPYLARLGSSLPRAGEAPARPLAPATRSGEKAPSPTVPAGEAAGRAGAGPAASGAAPASPAAPEAAAAPAVAPAAAAPTAASQTAPEAAAATAPSAAPGAAPPSGASAAAPGTAEAATPASATAAGPGAASPAAPVAASPAAPAGPAAAAPAPGAVDARAAESVARLRAVDPSPEREVALVQAAQVVADAEVAQADVLRIASQRRHFVAAALGGARRLARSFVVGGAASVIGLVQGAQAQVTGAVTGALASVTSAVMGGLQSAQAWAITTRAGLGAHLAALTASAQERVNGAAERITGLFNNLSLPDLPGVGAVRAAANRLVSGAAALVNRTLATTLRVVGHLADAGLAMIGALLNACTVTVGHLLAIAMQAIVGFLHTLTGVFARVSAGLLRVLNGLLHAVVLPALARLQALADYAITGLAGRALAALADNRRQALEALAEAVAPRRPGPPALRPPSLAERLAGLFLIRLDARGRGRLVVGLFDFITGGALIAIGQWVVAALGRVVALGRAFLASALAAVRQLVAAAVGMFRHLAALVAHTVGDILAALVDAGRSVAEMVARLIGGPLGAIVDFAGRAVTRIAAALGRLVADFIRRLTGGAARSADDAVGEFSPGDSLALGPLPAGPITKPLPPILELIFRIAAPIVVAAVTALMVFLFGPELALIIMANPVLVVVILLALALLLALAVLLLYLLLKLIAWIIKPGPPKKRVLAVLPADLELGVGGNDLRTRARISLGTPLFPPLTWTINPGGAPPVGVTVVGGGNPVRLRSAHPAHGTVLGGTTFTVRAALTANPSDFAVSGPITLIQVTRATYAAAPPLAAVPSLIPGTPPVNTGEPNRDGISGNRVQVNATTVPAGRGIRVDFRRSLGASASGATVKPGSATGDIQLAVRDRRTGATLDPTLPSTVVPGANMADLTINAVPLSVSSLTNSGALGPYGVLNAIGFASSDSLHPPLNRIVGELITNGGDDFNIPPPNGGFNPTFRLGLAVPANSWNDQLITPFNIAHAVDGRPAIDVNRFVGSGVPQLPRRLIYNQGFQYSSWQGAGTVVSKTFARGQHIRSLIGSPAAGFQFRTEHVFGSVAAGPRVEPYVGNPLVVFSAMTATLAAGATALAADGASTAAMNVTTTVAGLPVQWSVISGDMSFTAGNPSIPPAAATLTAGTKSGNFTLRAADVTYPNRRLDGRLRVAKVVLDNMAATPSTVPAGTLTSTVSLDAEPGARTVDWAVDATAAAAGVTVSPTTTGPGAPAMSVTVTRPAAFTGRVKVTASDRVTGRRASVRIRFR